MEITTFLYHNYWIYLPIAACIIYFSAKETLRLLKLPTCYRLLIIVSILGVLYPLTKVSQFFMIGPTWFRSYGADIGFVPCMTFFVTLFSLKEMNFKVIKSVIWLTAICAMLHEMMQIYLLNSGHFNLSLVKGLTGRGDFIDLWIFFGTLVLCLFIADQTFRRAQKMWQKNYEGLHNNEKKRFAKQYETTFKNLGIETK